MDGKREFWREFVSHLGVTVVYLLIVSLFTRSFSLRFWIGGIVGIPLLDIDHLLYLFMNSEEKSCQKFFGIWGERKYQKAIFYLVSLHKNDNKRKLLHNGFFGMAWAVLCLLILMISKSLFLMGLMLSVYLHLLKDIIEDLSDMEHLKGWLFWPLKKTINNPVTIIYVNFLIIQLLLLTGLVFYPKI
ncbi:MAG: hypothetical protein ACE5PV_08650 [Candidatus Poribacteria bacterium]